MIIEVILCNIFFPFVFYREWPNPVLLKSIIQPSDSKLGLHFPVWDPRVSIISNYCTNMFVLSITVTVHFIVWMVVSTDKSSRPISLDAYYNTSLPPAELNIQCVHVDENYYERRI